MSNAVQSVLTSLVDRGYIAGAASILWRGGGVAHAGVAGLRDLEAGLPVQRDTIFRIASLTKPITTVAALKMFDEGLFALDEPITRWAPEFATPRVLRALDGPLEDTVPAARPITFRDLLTQRSGITYGAFWPGPLAEAYAAALGGDIDSPVPPDRWIAGLAALPLIAQPGAGFQYGHSTDLLGLLLARMAGEPLDQVLQRLVLGPLGMRDTAFVVPAKDAHRRAASIGVDEADRPTTRRGGPGGSFLPHRPPEWAYVSGGQGLWSTVDDYLAFARLFLGDGAVDGRRLLRPETLALLVTDQLTPAQRAEATMFGMPLFGSGHGYGMGVAVVTDAATAAPSLCGGHVGSVGWPGAFGGWWQADPVDGSVMILLTHSMVELDQLARGLGLGGYVARSEFHRACTGG